MSDTPSWPFPRDTGCPMAPPPALASVREQTRLADIELWDGSICKMATRFEDVKAILMAPESSSDTSRPGFPFQSASMKASRGAQRNLVRMDPPRHDEHRLMLTADFTVKRTRAMRPQIDGLVEDLIANMKTGDNRAELVSELAEPIPAEVFGALLGLPTKDNVRLFDWVKVWMSEETSPEDTTTAHQAVLDYLGELVAERRAAPGDDLLSRLVVQRVGAGHLTDDELLHMLQLLVLAGFDTTANMIALGTSLLLEHREQWDALCANPDLVPGAVEELLRYLTVVHFTAFRQAKEEMVIAGVEIEAGQALLAPIVAANHDPARFPDPHVFDIHRDARGHLAFGAGVHQCLGQALARVELVSVFTKLTQHFPNLRLEQAVPDMNFRNSMVYGVEQVWVTW